MGIRFRKSINLGGGFRINISKSGVGYSWGTKGYRITKTANGNIRETYSLPGTGISYTKENKKSSQNNMQNDEAVNVDIGDINDFQSSEYADIISSISRTIKLDKLTSVIIVFGALGIIFRPLLILILIGIILKIILLMISRVNLNYEMDEEHANIYDRTTACYGTLNKNCKLWRLTQYTNVQNRKTNAGANRSVNRKNIKIINSVPYYIKTNVNALTFDIGKEKIVILPDKMLIIRNSQVGAISYDSIKINVGTSNFVESETVPSDAEIINYTWQYVNKNGSPDKRYKNNRKLPVCKYGTIEITSVEGLNLFLYCSNKDSALEFYRLSQQI